THTFASAGSFTVTVRITDTNTTTSVGGSTATATAPAAVGTPGDITPPTSSVAALPAFFASTSFPVTWSGADNPGGSGLASYDVFVSDNGGPFTPFQTATTQTSAAFTGNDGHTYAFYSVATDHAGNRQVTPATAQAVTTVNGAPPTSAVAFSAANYSV